MKPLISIIVPIYKVEPYLRQCIDSIINQTYKNLEIILVDDGSPDNCGAICDEYMKKDERIKVLHKKNGGLSDARNVGIDIASGKYLSFIDSDDWIESDMIEILYNNLVKNDADISCCGFYQSYVHLNIPINSMTELLILNGEQALWKNLLSQDLNCFAWGKLYKRYIFNNIRYPCGKYYEDVYVIVDILSKVNKVFVDTFPKYYYRQRKSSVVRSKYNAKTMDGVKAAERNHKFIEENYSELSELVEVSKCNVILAHISVLKSMIYCKNFRHIPEYKQTVALIRKNYRFILKSSYVRKNDKISVIAIKINIIFFKLIYSLYKLKDRLDGKVLFE